MCEKKGVDGVALNARQEKFVLEWLKDMNATQAAIRAGYSEKTAYSIGNRLLKHVEIQNAITEARERFQTKSIATVKDIEEFLSKSMRGETDEEVLITMRTETGADIMRRARKQISLKDRIRAAELLGKRYGLFSEKLTLEAPIPVIISGSDDLED